MAENRRCWLMLAWLLIIPMTAFGAMPVRPPPAAAVQSTRIVAVVNGEVISNIDVDNRARLFALSTGLPLTPDVIDRLKQQILRQLIDERLRMQEVQRAQLSQAHTRLPTQAAGTLKSKATASGQVNHSSAGRSHCWFPAAGSSRSIW